MDDGCALPVAVGSTCTIRVRFAPEATGPSTATLTLVSNTPSAAGPIELSGTGGSLPQGQPGAAGAQGQPGTQGQSGSSGQVELVTCRAVTKKVKVHGRRRKATRQRCTTKLVSGPVTFTAGGAAVHAARSLR